MTFEEMRVKLISVLDAAKRQEGFDTDDPHAYVPSWWLDDLEHLIERLNTPLRSVSGHQRECGAPEQAAPPADGSIDTDFCEPTGPAAIPTRGRA